MDSRPTALSYAIDLECIYKLTRCIGTKDERGIARIFTHDVSRALLFVGRSDVLHVVQRYVLTRMVPIMPEA